MWIWSECLDDNDCVLIAFKYKMRMVKPEAGEGRGGEGRGGEGRGGEGREGKGREGKGREGKGREGKGREGESTLPRGVDDLGECYRTTNTVRKAVSPLFLHYSPHSQFLAMAGKGEGREERKKDSHCPVSK
jgi:hypothetical protein